MFLGGSIVLIMLALWMGWRAARRLTAARWPLIVGRGLDLAGRSTSAFAIAIPMGTPEAELLARLLAEGFDAIPGERVAAWSKTQGAGTTFSAVVSWDVDGADRIRRISGVASRTIV